MTSKEKLQLAVDKGYHVDKDGQLLRNGKPSPFSLKKKKKNGIILPPYRRFELYAMNKRRWVMIHRLAAYQKYGDQMFEKGIQVRHLNTNSLDNRSSNLALGTARDNRLDKIRQNALEKKRAANFFNPASECQK